MKRKPRKQTAAASRRSRPRRSSLRPKRSASASLKAAPVTAAELRALKRQLEKRMRPSARRQPLRWNPDPADVQKSVAQLVLTVVEFLRQLMERQAIRRMEQKTLSAAEVEAIGVALMRLEETVRDMGKRFGLSPEDLNLDLGPVKLI